MGKPFAVIGRDRRRALASRLERTAETVLFIWLGLTAAVMVWDLVSQLPPPPPTPAQVAAATPKALADWKIVSGRLARRLPGSPLELGKVWTTHTGRICGLVDHREAAIDNMTPFYTVGLVPILRDDDLRRYFHEWLYCLGDYVVELHAGSQDAGFCASKRGRSTAIARYVCLPR